MLELNSLLLVYITLPLADYLNTSVRTGKGIGSSLNVRPGFTEGALSIRCQARGKGGYP